MTDIDKKLRQEQEVDSNLKDLKTRDPIEERSRENTPASSRTLITLAMLMHRFARVWQAYRRTVLPAAVSLVVSTVTANKLKST